MTHQPDPPGRPYRWQELVGQFAGIRHAPGTHRVALRSAITVAVSVGSLCAIGRPEWTSYAIFGTFACVYGGPVPTRARWRIQAGLAVLLTVAVVTGTLIALAPARGWMGLRGRYGLGLPTAGRLAAS